MTKKSRQPKPEEATALVTVTIDDRSTLFFREAVGTAKANGQEWEMSLNVSGRHPIIRLPDGRWATFSWQTLIEAANDAGRQAAPTLAKGRTP